MDGAGLDGAAERREASNLQPLGENYKPMSQTAPGSNNTENKGRRFGGRTGEPFTFSFEDRTIEAWPGESVAAALLAAGEVVLRIAEDGGARGVVCGIGLCWECRCIIDERPNVRACMTQARENMQVQRQQGLG